MDVIVCPNCQWEQSGGAECERCGVIFDRYRKPDERPIYQHEGEEAEIQLEKAAPSLLRRLFRLTLVVSTAVSVLILFLIFRLATPPEVQRDANATGTMEEKLANIRAALEEGDSYSAELTEAETNSLLWLAMTGGREPDQNPKTNETPVRDVRARLAAGQAHIYLAFRALGKTLTLTTTSSLVTRDRQVRLDPQRGALGSLPLPRFALDWISRRIQEAPETKMSLTLPEGVDVQIVGDLLVITVNPVTSATTASELMKVVD